MKLVSIAIAFLCLSLVGKTQCTEEITGKQLQKGMFIRCDPGATNKKKYVAEILSANGTNFSCRFLHSNSVYEFTDFKKPEGGSAATMQATVKSSKGGGFMAGTIFKMNIFMADPSACNLSTTTETKPYEVIATFQADKKSYLGWLIPNGNGYNIRFAHSGSTYTCNSSFKVTAVQGGGYSIGSQMDVVHARTLNF